MRSISDDRFMAKNRICRNACIYIWMLVWCFVHHTVGNVGSTVVISSVTTMSGWRAVAQVKLNGGFEKRRFGSLSILWLVFYSACLSLFFELFLVWETDIFFIKNNFLGLLKGMICSQKITTKKISLNI